MRKLNRQSSRAAMVCSFALESAHLFPHLKSNPMARIVKVMTPTDGYLLETITRNLLFRQTISSFRCNVTLPLKVF